MKRSGNGDEAGGDVRVRILAPAKVNLNLRVTGKCEGGYHSIESWVVPVGLYDKLRMSVRADVAHPCVTLSVGKDSEFLVPREENLVVLAAEAFLRRTGARVAVEIELSKRIPVGAGLGGGSSDAAAVLCALDRVLGTRCGNVRLAQWGLELGADVPFFVHGRPARIRGVGERVRVVGAPPFEWVVVAMASDALPTAAVYHAYDAALTNAAGASKKQNSSRAASWIREDLVNDLEEVAVQMRPEIAILKERIYQLGAGAALMTGSGAAVYGIWENLCSAQLAVHTLRVEGAWAQTARILARSPGIDSQTD